MLRVEGVVVGDYGVGKTSFLYALMNKQVPEQHVPTLLESHCMQVTVKEQEKVELVLWDTPGCEDYMQLAQMGLTKKDFVMLCFSVIDSASFENVEKHWIPEIRAKLPNVPLILIGTQVDQRNQPHVVDALVDKDTPPIAFEQGEKLADNIGAVCYMECSALCPSDIDKVRQVTASIANEHKQRHKGKKCLIL